MMTVHCSPGSSMPIGKWHIPVKIVLSEKTGLFINLAVFNYTRSSAGSQIVMASWSADSTGSSAHVRNHKVTVSFEKSTRFCQLCLNYENGPPRGNLGNTRGKITRLYRF
jgi:hypothetical protein